jgi:hypothetical protein
VRGPFRSIEGATRAVLLLVGLALAGLTVGLFILQAIEAEGPPSLDREARVGDARNVNTHAGCNEPPTTDSSRPFSPPDNPRLGLTVAGFDPHALTVTLGVTLCAPEGFLSRLGEVTTKKNGAESFKRLATKSGSNLLKVRPAFRRASIAVLYQAAIPGPGQSGEASGPTTERHITLNALIGTAYGLPAPVVSLGQIVLPLAASPGRYPFDWYALRGELDVASASFGTAFVLCHEHEYCVREFPFDVAVLSDNLSPFVLHASVVTSESAGKGDRHLINIRLERNSVTRWYIIAVAIVPFVLSLLLCIVLFWTPSRPVGTAGITGVAAVLLAILPIRLVLVPGEVTGLTLVDYWLGFVMGFLVLVACLAVRQPLGRSDDIAGTG